VLLNLVVYFLVDFRLQARDLLLFAHQHEHFFHPAQQRYRVEDILQVPAASAGHGGTEIGQRGTVVGAETGKVLLDVLTIEGIGSQQFLDGADDGEGIGLQFIGLFLGFIGVFHLHQVGWLAP